MLLETAAVFQGNHETQFTVHVLFLMHIIY